MSKEQILTLIKEGIVEDMTFLYTNANIDQELQKKYLEEGEAGFSLIASNTVERLVNLGLINLN